MRSTLEQPIPLQEAEAARQCHLVDGESTLELLQVRLTHVGDGRENAELRNPEAARPQDIVIELRHRAADHSQRGADTGRQAVAALLKPHRGGSRSHTSHSSGQGRTKQAHIMYIHKIIPPCETGSRPAS